MNEDAFLLFGTGFFLLCMLLSVTFIRRDQERLDRLEETRYNRMLNERREFGYQNAGDSD